MATRNENDDYDWAMSRDRRRASLHALDEDDYGAPPPLKATLLELAMTLAGFVGLILVVYAVLGAFR